VVTPVRHQPWRLPTVIQHAGMPAWSAPRDGAPLVAAAAVQALNAFQGADGDGVRVCILDTGVDPTHPRVGPIECSMGVVETADGVEVVEVASEDSVGHGTACAGVIRALAPKAAIASVRVLTSGVQGSGSVLVAGLRWAVERGYDVVNLSLSTARPVLRMELGELCDTAYFRRTVICAAANNSPRPSYPWRFATVLSVGSCAELPGDPAGGYAHCYNPAPPVEFYAPGVDVEVAWTRHAVIRATGNSFATPYLAGLCALLLSKHQDLTPFEVKTLLMLTARNVGGIHAD
jgi:subtilisin